MKNPVWIKINWNLRGFGGGGGGSEGRGEKKERNSKKGGEYKQYKNQSILSSFFRSLHSYKSITTTTV